MSHRRVTLALAFGLFCALSTTPSHAESESQSESDCEFTAGDVPALEWDDLVDGFLTPECLALTEPVAARLEKLIQDQQWPEEQDRDGIREIGLMVKLAQLRATLWQQDTRLVQQRLNEIHTLEQAWRATIDPSSEDAEADIQDLEELSARWNQIAGVLSGKTRTAAVKAFETPPAEWTISFGMCGTPAMMFFAWAGVIPSTADAYVAVGRPEIGLQVLLAEQWADAMSLGLTPPRLRDFAERAFGSERYESEIESALAGIRIDQTPAGRQAGMPLFGLWVPVPLGTKSWRNEEVTRFETPADIADYLRPKLLLSGEMF